MGWCWVAMQWNLSSRTNNIETCHLEHISWHGDALRIVFAKSKSDQTGEGMSNEKHVYPNPFKPEVCAIVSLAVYFFSGRSSQSHLPDTKLFQGTYQKTHWSDLLGEAVAMIDDNIDLGCQKQDSKYIVMNFILEFSRLMLRSLFIVGTHSIRKGSVTYLLSLLDGPSAIMVYLRAGWSLGNVPDRYIHAGTGSDQLVGRAIALLPLHSSDFAILGPHLKLDGIRYLAEVGWDSLVPGYSRYPGCFKNVIPYLIANLCHHYDWLNDNLPRNHPLWLHPLLSTHFRHFQALKQWVTLGCNFNKETNMTATGIPGHVAMNTALNDLKLKLQESNDLARIREQEYKDLLQRSKI